MSFKHLSDDELIERCRHRWYESMLQGRLGCGTAIALGSIMAIAVMAVLIYQQSLSVTNDPWWISLSSIILISMAGLIALIVMSPFTYILICLTGSVRARRYHGEAGDRFLPPSESKMKTLMEEQLGNEQRPIWIIGLSGLALPNGGMISLMIYRLPDTNRTTIVEIWRCAFIDLGEVDPRTEVKHTKDEANNTDIQKLETIVDSLAIKPLESVESHVIDGVSVAVLAALDEAPVIQKGGCNLSDQSAESQIEPAIILGREMVALANKFTNEQFVVGSCVRGSDAILIDKT